MPLEFIELPPDEMGYPALPVTTYRGVIWDLSHLTPFAFKVDPGLGFSVDVVVLFSCHCFTHSFVRDERSNNAIPDDEIYQDSRERRILDPVRYALSRELLPRLVHQLPEQRIIVANENQRNFMVWELQPATGTVPISAYAVFFDVEKDNRRKCRLILRIQSAYLLTEGLTKRQKNTKKVGWNTLLKAAYDKRMIRP